jgi:hypothetical protein
MAPQGESTGLTIEDSVLLTRVLEKFPDKPVNTAFERYERTIKALIDDRAYQDAVSRWERVKDRRGFDKRWRNGSLGYTYGSRLMRSRRALRMMLERRK